MYYLQALQEEQLLAEDNNSRHVINVWAHYGRNTIAMLRKLVQGRCRGRRFDLMVKSALAGRRCRPVRRIGHLALRQCQALRRAGRWQGCRTDAK
jgi:hypothetical protein